MRRFLILILLLPGVLLAQHSIRGVFSPPEDYEVALLYKVKPTISEYVTNTVVAEDGSFSFTLDSTQTKGMYRIVYAAPQEDYNFDILYNGKEDIALTFNSETGVHYKSSAENKLLASYTNSMSMVTTSISKFYQEKSTDTLALLSIFKTQRNAQKNYEKLAKGTLALNFIKANRPFVPEGFVNVATYVNQIKEHYFDAVDFTDVVLQSSSFLEERILNYVFGMTANGVDELTNYKNNIDVVCKAMNEAPAEVKRILLISLWQQFVDLKLEPIANYVTDTCLLAVAKTLNDDDLVTRLKQYENTSIGHRAIDFYIENETDNTKLSSIEIDEYGILVFWSSTCSHCLDELPKLEAFLKDGNKKSIKVVAVALDDNPDTWKKSIPYLPHFIHTYGRSSKNKNLDDRYGIFETPTYFILNKNKEIIAKPNDAELVKAFFKKKSDNK
ncbi:TlpA family protein disulfide reductase [Gaetbulibacter saemankumensis]|uniref:TlpA family protein disulfide reductase n=1 Tax=Gaetbulibacter saemankumensis TaxID=311208 RepID=UPI00041BB73D|nr:TlpA disulfide reductase family protein [Gaetbulibacter saemankumensis]